MSEGDGSGDDDVPDPRSGVVPALRWFWRSEDERVVFAREIVQSAAAVALVAAVLFAVSGVWPPMVAVESGSMEPNMHRGDLVFLVEEHRFASGNAVAGTGVVPHRVAVETGYRQFGGYGDVIVFKSPGSGGSPTIHRARLWVERGENWVADADPTYLQSTSCAEVTTCPADHSGFVTKGDNNPYYDQVVGIAPIVKPAWIQGRAVLRIPYLGHVRLFLAGVTAAKAGSGAAALGAVALARD